MTHIITSLCLRDSSCVDACPVACIVPGEPVEDWPWFYIDPATCIDCGACIPECPYEAIFAEEEVPGDYLAKGGEVQSMPKGTPEFTRAWKAANTYEEVVLLPATRVLDTGDEVDLTHDIVPNYEFFAEGPGYSVLEIAEEQEEVEEAVPPA